MPVSARLGVVVIALVLAASVSGRDVGQAHGQSPHKLDGAWTAVSAERNGQPAADFVGHALTFARDTFVIRSANGHVLYRGTYRVDDTRSPAHIDFRHTEGELKGK